MELLENNITDFTALLASKAPVPGGGGASALVGALGTALGGMVAALTLGKKKYADVEEEIKSLSLRAQELQNRLLECVDADAAAFEPLSRAYAIPKDAPGRSEIMEKCLRDAAQVPLEILRLCCEAIELHRVFADKGSVLAVSDAAAGAAFCKAALCGAAVNVKVNTAAMSDRDYARTLDEETDAMLNKYGKLADEIYNDVYGRLC